MIAQILAYFFFHYSCDYYFKVLKQLGGKQTLNIASDVSTSQCHFLLLHFGDSFAAKNNNQECTSCIFESFKSEFASNSITFSCVTVSKY